MFAQRMSQQALRRAVAGKPNLVSQMASKGMMAPAVMGASTQMRPVATQPMKPADSYEILVAQRRNRPVSPHLSIYRPQISWIPSMFNRITGATLSGTFYIFGSAYLLSPLFGWSLDSATMAAAFASWPVALKVATKFFFAMPFTFHSFNGIRHLIWDMGRQFQNKTVQTTGWLCVGVSTVSALALALLW